jgi:TetR/AcrR family transcriptional repressor of nem operon
MDCQLQNCEYAESVITSDADEAGRALTRKGRATRDRIVAAAASLMFEYGVAATTTEDVQKAAGVGASQMYHYFADRQELIRAVIAHQTRAVLANQQPYLGALDSFDALRAWRDNFIAIEQHLECKGGCPIGSLAGQLAETSTSYRDDLARGFTEWESAIHDGIQAMHARGELRADADPDQLAVALLAALQGGLLLTQLRGDTAPLEAALDCMISYLETLTSSPQRAEPSRRRRDLKTPSD